MIKIQITCCKVTDQESKHKIPFKLGLYGFLLPTDKILYKFHFLLNLQKLSIHGNKTHQKAHGPWHSPESPNLAHTEMYLIRLYYTNSDPKCPEQPLHYCIQFSGCLHSSEQIANYWKDPLKNSETKFLGLHWFSGSSEEDFQMTTNPLLYFQITSPWEGHDSSMTILKIIFSLGFFVPCLVSSLLQETRLKNCGNLTTLARGRWQTFDRKKSLKFISQTN